MAGQVKVEGVEETIANLKKWQFIKRGAIAGALKSVAFKVEGSAKKDGNTPVDTGRLRASLSTNWAGSPMNRGKVGSQAGRDDGVGKPRGEKELVYVVGSNVAYAKAQEYGLASGSKPSADSKSSFKGSASISSKKRGHTPRKRPSEGFLFLTKAYKKHEKEVKKRVSAVVKKDVKL